MRQVYDVAAVDEGEPVRQYERLFLLVVASKTHH